MKTYIDGWGNIEDMKNDFWEKLKYDWSAHEYNNELDGVDWLFAVYSSGSYEGSAFVLLGRGNDVFEVNASHCSCYGLEGQWSEDATTLEIIRDRIKNGLGKDDYSPQYNFHEELTKFINEVAS